MTREETADVLRPSSIWQWHTRSAGALLGMFLLGVAAPALAQEPATRAESLEHAREAKAKTLEPPVQNRLERILTTLENRRLLERLLNPAEGFYPKLGTVTSGSGLSLGPGYRRFGVFADDVQFSAFAFGSLRKYWMLDARLMMPQLAGGKAFADVHAQRYDFPQEDFFGSGPVSRREFHTTYGLDNTVLGAAGGIRPVPWLSLGGGIDHLNPRISAGEGLRTVTDLFSAETVPGIEAQPNYLRYEVFADLNYREPRGNPRRGGRYLATYQRFDDRDIDRYGFNRFEVDLQQYLPLVKDRRVLALHAIVSVSDTDSGQQVPFYLQRTLGGPDDLRGFRRYRFRDRNMLLMQAEYRWEIFTALDGAIFYDTGKVASRPEDLNLEDLESDYGIGFRFGMASGVFLRVEGAFGSSDGKHLVLRFGHVF
jgi:hypothetical protein